MHKEYMLLYLNDANQQTASLILKNKLKES